MLAADFSWEIVSLELFEYRSGNLDVTDMQVLKNKVTKEF